MYSYEDRLRAVRLYIKLGKRIGLTIRQLGYPTKNAPICACDCGTLPNKSSTCPEGSTCPMAWRPPSRRLQFPADLQSPARP